MIDKRLERNIEHLVELIGLWSRLGDALTKAVEEKKVEPDAEAGFLQLKSHVARRFEMLTHAIGDEGLPGDEITVILSQAVSLEQLATGTGMVPKKLESDWHGVYIELNKAMGRLEAQKEDLAQTSLIGSTLQGIFGNKTLAIVVVVLIVLVGGYVLMSGDEVDDNGDSGVLAWVSRGFSQVGSWLKRNIIDKVSGASDEDEDEDDDSGAWLLPWRAVQA